MSNGDLGLVSANNNVYIYNGSGWYKIATVQNDSPSAITGVDGVYNLATDGTATVITAVSTDPEGFPLTWSYSTSGLGSIATISQTDNVFTVTPSTDEANVGTFTLTINATDGVNGAVSANTDLTLQFILTVANSNYTTLLATATDTSDNNNITDSSTNNHTITVNGDAHAGTFSPYRSGGYSTYFDGTTNTYLNVSGGVALGSGDFTMSFWVYSNDLSSNNYLVDFRPLNVNTASYPHIRINSSGYFIWTAGGVDLLTGNTVVSSKEWIYFCIARDNGVTKMYVNGTQQNATYSGTQNFTNGTNRPVIGTGAYAITPMFDGYISDLRIVTSLDTAAYSVPTTRMSAITNTQLLTCHLPYIADGSSNGHSITVNGNPSTKPFTPYDNLEYSGSDNGGSVYFDGTGDYFYTYDATSAYANPSGLNLRDSAFTLEFWFYLNGNTSGLHTFFNTYSGSILSDANETLKFSIRGSDDLIALYDKVAAVNILETTKHIPQQTWNHFCWTRDASYNHVFYLNGKQIGTSTSNTWLINNTWVFGTRVYNNTQSLTGYMSDISLTKGSVTRASEFTPPTAPLSSSGTELHIKGTDASIIDKSQVSNLKLVGNTTGSTTQVKFTDTKSMYFDGTGDYALVTGVPDLGDDFTIEAWIYSTATGNAAIVGSVDNYGSFSGSGYWNFMRNAGNKLILYIDSGTYTQSTSTVPLNQWVHVACTRSSGTIYYYIDGTRDSTTVSNSLSLKNPSGVVVGSSPNNNYIYNFNGYIQDLRLTVGNVRYTAADESSNIPSAPLKG